MSNSRVALSENLKALMLKKGIRRNQLCEDLGIPYSTLASWLDCSKYPRVENLEIVAKYLGVSVSQLIGDEAVKDFAAACCNFVDTEENSVRVMLTEHELKVIQAYRNLIGMQKAVDKLLDIDSE